MSTEQEFQETMEKIREGKIKLDHIEKWPVKPKYCYYWPKYPTTEEKLKAMGKDPSINPFELHKIEGYN